MPNNLNHLVSPTFAQKKNNIFRQERAAPEKAKSRNASKTGLGEVSAAAKSMKTNNFEGTFSRQPSMISTITTEIAEPTISASITTMSQMRENAGHAGLQRQGKQSVSKTTRTGNFERKQSYGGTKTSQYETCKLAA